MVACIVYRKENRALHPYVGEWGLPMLKIAGRPLIYHQLSFLRFAGIAEAVIFSRDYDGSLAAYLETVKRDFGFALRLEAGEGPAPVSLGRLSSALAADYSGDIIYMDGEVLPDFDAADACALHEELCSRLTAVLRESTDPGERLVASGSLGRIEGLIDFPAMNYAYQDLTFSGICILSAELLRADRKHIGAMHSPEEELIPYLLKTGVPLYSHSCGGFVMRMESLRDVKLASRRLIEKTAEPGRAAGGLSGCSILEPSLISPSAEIGKNSVIGPYSIVEDRAVIGESCRLSETVVHEGATLGERCRADGAFVMEGAAVGEGSFLEELSVIGRNAVVEAGSRIKKNVRVWPDKKVSTAEPDSIETAAAGPADRFEELRAEDIYSLGERFSDMEASPVILAGYGSSGMNAAEGFASGAAAAGARVYLAPDVPEAIWRFAAFQYNCDYGVYFREESGRIKALFCSRLGAEFSCRDRHILFEGEDRGKILSGSGSKTVLNALPELYEAYLRRVFGDGSRICAKIRSADPSIKKAAESCFIECENGEEPTFFIGDGGTAFTVSDEKGVYYCEEYTKRLVAFCTLTAGSTLYIPEDTVLAEEEFIRAAGGKIIRVSPYDRELLSRLFSPNRLGDAAVGIGTVIRAMRKTGKTLHELGLLVPKYHVYTVTARFGEKSAVGFRNLFKRAAELSREFAEEYRSCGSEEKNPASASGLSLRTRSGSVFISPLTSRRVVISGISDTEERARALCTEYKNAFSPQKKINKSEAGVIEYADKGSTI